jgi:hypothetical protein
MRCQGRSRRNLGRRALVESPENLDPQSRRGSVSFVCERRHSWAKGGDSRAVFPNGVSAELPDPGTEESDGKTGRRAWATPFGALVLPSLAGVG